MASQLYSRSTVARPAPSRRRSGRFSSTRSTALANADGLVADQDVLAVDGRETLAADRRADDGLAHRPGVQDLQARAAADPERHDVARGVAHQRPHVVDVAGQLDAMLLAVEPLLFRRRPADPAHGDVRPERAEMRQDLLAEEVERVGVRKRRRAADERDARSRCVPSGRNSSMSTPLGTTATRAAGAMRAGATRSWSETATFSATRAHQLRSTLVHQRRLVAQVRAAPAVRVDRGAAAQQSRFDVVMHADDWEPSTRGGSGRDRDCRRGRDRTGRRKRCASRRERPASRRRSVV